MIELTDWMQQNWLELGTLLAQAAIPIILIWYGRKLLKTLEVSRHGAPAIQSLRVTAINSPPDAAMIAEEERETAPGVARRFTQWLQQPMTNHRTTPSPWRRLARWLQAPVGS